MLHDAWPPLPPGGHRPPDAPPFTSPGDQLLALGLGASAGAGALVWATGQLAGLAFGHTWLDLAPADVAQVLWHLPQHWSDPQLAWPADARGPLPGPTGMYVTFAGLVGGISGGTAALLRHLPGRAAGHRPGYPRPAKHAGALWASGRELRLLTVREPEPGRVILGRTPGVLGRLLAAEDCHSVLVFGPTGSYKTSALVIPGVLEWSGPLLATSVKPDLLRATLTHRARLGQVLVIDPLGASGVTAAKWSPLASCGTWAGAQQMAVMLANAIEQTPTEEQRPEHRFWKTMGTKFLAPMLYAAAVKGLGMRDVLHWLDSREDQQIKDILDAAGVPAALDAWESSQYRTDRAVDSLYATAEEVLHVYANERVAASTEGHDLDLDHFLSGDHTIYLYAPAHQQRLLRPLFEAITQQVVAATQEQAALAPDGMLSPRLGLFLDEAGNCAALSDLDVLATTARGQGIQLVTVWHDKSQLEARYGTKASTILNNHRAKLFLSGLADLSALELGARLIGDQALVERNRSMGSDGRHSLNESTSYRPLLPVEDLRRLRPGEGVLLYGHLRPPRSACGPTTPPASSTGASGRRSGRRGGWRGRSGALAARPNASSSAYSAAGTASRPSGRRRGWSGRSGKGAGDDPPRACRRHPRQPTGPERPTDPRPAWERVAYTWLEREVDAGQPLDPTELAHQVSVAPDLARDLLRVLRGQRDRDPGLAELRARLVRDRITDAHLRRELAGDQRLDPAELAAEVGTTTTITRQWLASLRHQQGDGGVLVEPASHGRPTPEQLAGLQAHFAAGGHQHAAVAGRPTDLERLAAEVERHYWTREVRGHERLRPRQLARELGGDPRQISQQLAELRAGPATAGERIAQLWHAQQQDPTARPLSSSRLAWRLGVSDSYVRHRTWQLRTRSGQAPLGERLAATQKQLASPPPPVERAGGERDWRLDAACANVDPELFFPEAGQVPQAAQAKAVCAGCVVRGLCLEAALHGPQARDDHSGIFAGTTARQRVALRGRASMAAGTRFVHDRAAAEAALALANEVSIYRAARELGVSKQALRRAFDHHGLPQPQVFQGGPTRTRFYADRDAAEQAWRRAAEVGINQTRKELGVSDRALRNAWQRHGLGLPPRPTSTSRPATRRLDGAFLQLNRKLLPARARSDQELAARVRRAEEYAVFGAEVVVEMGSETYGKRPAARVWAITRRAQRAQYRTSDRQGRTERRQADRASRTDRCHRARAPVQEREVTADAR